MVVYYLRIVRNCFYHFCHITELFLHDGWARGWFSWVEGVLEREHRWLRIGCQQSSIVTITLIDSICIQFLNSSIQNHSKPLPSVDQVTFS